MRIRLGSFVTALLLIMETTNAEIEGCDFFDTVDLSSAQKLSTGSYLYKDIRIPKNLTGEYDYKLLANGTKEKVTVHTRGCVCQLSPCVRFCCPPNQIMENGVCHDDMTKKELDELDPYLNVTLDNKSVVRKNFKTDLIVQSDWPMACDHLFYLDNREKEDEYTLFENGTMLRHFDNVFLNKREYCLQHMRLDDGSIRIAPHICMAPKTSRTGQTLVMIISMICLVLTISMYLFFKELRTLLDKSFICYMICLFMVYFFQLLDLWDLSQGFCMTAAFMGYFFVMASFLWLSVISLHIWLRLGHYYFEHCFPAYSLYAWGMALVLTEVTLIAHTIVENKDWNPRVGFADRCWINTKDWSAMIYFYGPILILVAFNIIMFILTTIRINEIKRELKLFLSHQGDIPSRYRKLKSTKSSFIFFLWLFIMMGLSWSLEIISYLVDDNKLWSQILLVADYLNWCQGTIIFILFILNASKLDHFKKR
ncbi:G-protein coupled receptor Mth-like [Drosophila rhopaloa]|uniref:G-protein coupled receptor Mth-like n=1 Tax=Drosophila rhopaloa TaxID=1041015 RepID=A0A6P4EX66_DRORH|nr:G-protein coupled receptor Mth-like [Drosophila rhopaloa]